MQSRRGLVDLLDSWATSPTTARSSATHVRHATTWHTALTTCCLVDLHHDRVHNSLKFLLFGLEFILLCQLILVQPVESFLDRLLDLVLIVCLKLVLQLLFLQSVAHRETIIFKAILCLDLGLVCFV